MIPRLNSQGKSDAMYLLSRGSGDPVLFLHGIPTSCHLWDGVVDRMEGTFTCMAVDLPGLGRTPKTREGFGELNTIVATLEALRIKNKVEKWHVVGHDAGCVIAVHYAHRYPAHTGRLALLTPSIFPELEPFFLFELLRKPLLGELAAPLINLIFWRLVMRRTLDGSQSGRDALADFRAPFSGPLGAWRLMSLLRWGKPAEVLAAIPTLLPELLMPTLIFHGALDPAVPAKFAMRASGLIPDSEMVLTNSGHFLPMNEPAVIADRLLNFFGRSTSVEPHWLEADATV
ncbi:MAG TPA: alpha/beta hydrolase [Edaphobacter sp.]|nr:alpha/beta hydrolase [Edaphobacter sp.]